MTEIKEYCKMGITKILLSASDSQKKAPGGARISKRVYRKTLQFFEPTFSIFKPSAKEP